MFKKTNVRSILELLGENLSAREVSKVLSVSRNTVAEVQTLFLQSGRSWNVQQGYEKAVRERGRQGTEGR